MHPEEVYKFCLLCGSPYKKAERKFLQCTKCEFKQYLNPIPGIAAVIENDHGEILLVKRKRNPHKGKWDVPGGFIDSGEDAFVAIKRELREELGVEINEIKLIAAYADDYHYQGIILPTLNLYVSAKLDSLTLQPNDDVSAYHFFSKDKVLSQTISFKTVRRILAEYLANNA